MKQALQVTVAAALMLVTVTPNLHGLAQGRCVAAIVNGLDWRK